MAGQAVPSGGGAEGGQVTVRLAGGGRVIRAADRDGERVEPAGAVAQLVTGELRPRVGEHGAGTRRRGREYAVEVVDAGVDCLVVAAAQADADRRAEVVEVGVPDDDDPG